MIRLATWRPPYDFLAARPTFVDAWPEAWCALAPKQEFVPLNHDEMNALGWQIAGFRHWFPPIPATPLVSLAYRLDAAIQQVNKSSFIRLTSRSPKDSLYAQRRGLHITNGSQALALIMEGSKRCAADLRMAIEHHIEMAIVVRKWLEYPPSAEFRCFMVDRAFVAASQFEDLGVENYQPLEKEQAHSIVQSLFTTMNYIASTSTIANAAIDLVCTSLIMNHDAEWPAVLIDVNPLTQHTDLGLFSSMTEFDQSVRFRNLKSGDHVSLSIKS